MSDADCSLLAAASEGDSEAWTALYGLHSKRVYRYGLAMCGSVALAEEATQETFLALLNLRGRFDPALGSLAGWLLGVARNKVLRLLERERSHGGLEEIDGRGSAISAAGSIEVAVQAAETRSAVRRAVLALPANYREVVVLCDLEEMDYAAAAAVLSCPVGTVRSRLHRARQLLAVRLAPLQAGAGKNSEGIH